MPKNRMHKKVDGRTVTTRAGHKFRIGNRRSGKSALAMTTEQLQRITSGKDARKAQTVLAMRGVQ